MTMPQLLAGIKKLVVLDAETFWAKDYTLRTMRPQEYVADARFQLIGWSMKLDRGEPIWVTDPGMIDLLFTSIDWSSTAVIGHNLPFDATILTMRYGLKPALWIDTLGMARARIRPFTGRVGLAECAEFLRDRGIYERVPAKGNMAQLACGMRKEDMSPQFLERYGSYANDDVRITAAMAKWLLPQFSDAELRLLDRTVRMYTEPVLRLNPQKLRTHLETVIATKEALRAEADASRSDLMSNEKFAGMLEARGVEVPTKVSKTTGKKTLALSKKDVEFKALLQHDDPQVQALVAARLGTKSTLEETRSKALLDLAIDFGTLAVPLLYCGAHTTRYSGGMKLNLQNLTGGSPIRDAIEAPRGHRLVVADARQIEARVLSAVAGQRDKVERFANGDDVYSRTAEGIYHHPVSQESHPRERKVGKVADLSLGYGSGDKTFWLMCMGANVDISPAEAKSVVAAWRGLNGRIVELWADLYDVFRTVAMSRRSVRREYRGVAIIGKSVEENAAYIESPEGMRVWYYDPRVDTDKFGKYGFGYKKFYGKTALHKRLWHGEVTNNLIQFLAREITMGHAVRLTDYPVARMVLQVHDELVFVVKEQHAERVKAACELVMSTPPAWAKHVPLAAEVAIGRTYGEAK